jgi:epoxyqueuosine reductase
MITSEMVKTYAKQHGADLVGIASIERFKDAPPETNPLNIYPETKSVIVLACRILEGSYKGIEQGTDWSTYWIYGYGSGIYSALTNSTNKLQSYIESFGYEAVISPGIATLLETPPKQQPVAKGKMPPNVVLHIRISAALAGLGELGWSKVFLTPEFGPRQRFEVILTDAELEQDPLMQENICDKCMQCVRHCPGHAISNDEEVSITVEGRKFSWGNIHLGKCKVTHWGINPEASPFIQKDLAGLNMDAKVDSFVD